MRTLIAAALVAAYSLPALGQGDCGRNCTVAHRQPLEARELCFAQTAALRAVVEAQSMEIIRLRAELERAAHHFVATNKVMPAKPKPLPCKKGRTRNSSGVCGRWK